MNRNQLLTILRGILVCKGHLLSDCEKECLKTTIRVLRKKTSEDRIYIDINNPWHKLEANNGRF